MYVKLDIYAVADQRNAMPDDLTKVVKLNMKLADSGGVLIHDGAKEDLWQWFPK